MTARLIRYTLDAVKLTHDISFTVTSSDGFDVYVNRAKLDKDVDYDVIGSVDDLRKGDGKITLKKQYTAGDVLLILSDTLARRVTNFAQAARFEESEIDNEFDNLLRLFEDAILNLQSTPYFSPPDIGLVDGELPALIAGGVLRVNEHKNGFELVELDKVPEFLEALRKCTEQADRSESEAGKSESSAQRAQGIADSIGQYRGLWPNTGGSAQKGDTWQTQSNGVPTGRFYTALKGTVVAPIADNNNWRASLSEDTISTYAKISYRSIGGKSAIENMIAGSPIAAKVGDYCSTGGASWRRKRVSTPSVLSDFERLTVLYVKSFCPMNGVDDDLPGLMEINSYIKTLPSHTQTGAGFDCGGVLLDCSGGQLYVGSTWTVERSRSLTISGMVINPLAGFPRGDWLFHADNTVDTSAYGHEDLTLMNPSFRGGWEANLLKLTDFLRVCLVNPKFERYYQYGMAIADKFNVSHELSWFNASFFQRFYNDAYPSHIPASCQPFVIDSPDNELTTTIVGYCKGNIGSVTNKGSATVFNGYHFYEGAFKLDGTHTFFRNGYWDGSHLRPSTTNWKVTDSFIQATSNSFEFIRGLTILGYSNITGCTFRFVPASGQDNPSNYGSIFDSSIHAVAADASKFFGNLVKDNSLDRWNSFVIDRDTTQQHVIAPDDWAQLNGYWFAEVPFPRYLGNRATSYTMSEIDYTKFCAIFDDGTKLRIRCYYVNGAGTVKPSGIVTVWADNKVAPNYQ